MPGDSVFYSSMRPRSAADQFELSEALWYHGDVMNGLW